MGPEMEKFRESAYCCSVASRYWRGRGSLPWHVLYNGFSVLRSLLATSGKEKIDDGFKEAGADNPSQAALWGSCTPIMGVSIRPSYFCNMRVLLGEVAHLKGRNMKPSGINRRLVLSTLALLPAFQSQTATAQQTKRRTDSAFSFAVYGDSRSMMYLPYKSDQREEAIYVAF
jgi:hypothetical protein